MFIVGGIIFLVVEYLYSGLGKGGRLNDVDWLSVREGSYYRALGPDFSSLINLGTKVGARFLPIYLAGYCWKVEG